MDTKIAEFLAALAAGTADEGAAAALWHAVKLHHGGRVVIDQLDPEAGWSLEVQPHEQQARYVVLVAKGRREG
jgi:hypothetical protein